jgi:hypothetical protein
MMPMRVCMHTYGFPGAFIFYRAKEAGWREAPSSKQAKKEALARS